MKNHTRPVRIEFRVTEQERQLIQKKMEQLGTKNMGAYLRKMAIDGYIIKVDYTEQKKLALPSAMWLLTSITSAAASIMPGDSMQTMLPS